MGILNFKYLNLITNCLETERLKVFFLLTCVGASMLPKHKQARIHTHKEVALVTI